MPDTRLVYSLWNLRNNLWMAKSQLCRPSILSNVTTNKNELWKTAIAIRFNLLQVCPSLTPFLFVAWFIPYSYLFECFFFLKFHSIWRPFPLFAFWYISWHNSLKVILTIVHSTVYLFLHRFLILRKKPTSLKLLSAVVVAAGLFISLIPTIFPTVGGKNKAEPANENGTISRIMWPIIFMLGSVRNINMYTYSFT